MEQLHIIEPTLADEAGHCHGYVQSMVAASQAFGYQCHIWLARRGHRLYRDLSCQVHPYFYRRWRKLQQLFCLRSLLSRQRTVFVPTAGRIDLVYIDWLLGEKPYGGKIFLHFHQFKINDKKIALLKKIAWRHPELMIMTTTPALKQIFLDSGFVHCYDVPCPGYPSAAASHDRTGQFRHVIYAGSARADKGFVEAVDFAAYLAQQHIHDVPVSLQVSPPFSGHHDRASLDALVRLQTTVNLPQLTLYRHTLNQTDYQALFRDAICLAAYDGDSYRDKFSGVSFDAFCNACPIIAVANTWASAVVDRFGAGVVIAERTPATIYQAVQTIRRDYARYQSSAQRAGDVLVQEHDPANTWRVITGNLSS